MMIKKDMKDIEIGDWVRVVKGNHLVSKGHIMQVFHLFEDWINDAIYIESCEHVPMRPWLNEAIAWFAGEVIEYERLGDNAYTTYPTSNKASPSFNPKIKHRVKPKEPSEKEKLFAQIAELQKQIDSLKGEYLKLQG